MDEFERGSSDNEEEALSEEQNKSSFCSCLSRFSILCGFIFVFKTETGCF